MAVINGDQLLMASPIVDMLATKERANGVSHGLVEVGYDIRIKQDVWFAKRILHGQLQRCCRRSHDEAPAFSGRGRPPGRKTCWHPGRFILASAMEEFRMPNNLMGIVHDKSSWARRGLSVFNTVIEPGWCGFLTLELVHHGEDDLFIPAGSGIAQVIFHEVALPAAYEGKYQHQADRPVEALSS